MQPLTQATLALTFLTAALCMRLPIRAITPNPTISSTSFPPSILRITGFGVTEKSASQATSLGDVGPNSFNFTIHDTNSTVNQGNCFFPATYDYSSIPPLAYNVPQSCSPPTYQYALTEYGGPTFIKLSIEHTVSTSNGTVHAKSCIIDRAVAGSGPQGYECNSGIGLPAPFGWIGDPVTLY